MRTKIKNHLRAIFAYPKDKIDLNFDYDKYWQERRGDSGAVLNAWQEERAAIISKMITNGSSVADVGCGDGAILAAIRDKAGAGRVVGYDSSQEILEKARAIGVETHQFDMNGDLSELGQADYYLLLETLEHMANSEKLLGATLAKSNKGVFFSFPNSGYFTYRLRLLFGKFPAQWRVLPNEHLRFWTTRDLHWWLEALGYKKYKVIHYQGIPVLNKIWPSMFAAGLLVYLEG